VVTLWKARHPDALAGRRPADRLAVPAGRDGQPHAHGQGRAHCDGVDDRGVVGVQFRLERTGDWTGSDRADLVRKDRFTKYQLLWSSAGAPDDPIR